MANVVRPPVRKSAKLPKNERRTPIMKQIIKPFIRVDQLNVVPSLIYKNRVIHTCFCGVEVEFCV